MSRVATKREDGNAFAKAPGLPINFRLRDKKESIKAQKRLAPPYQCLLFIFVVLVAKQNIYNLRYLSSSSSQTP